MTRKETKILNAIVREKRTIQARNNEIKGLMAMTNDIEAYRELKQEQAMNFGMLDAYDYVIIQIATA